MIVMDQEMSAGKGVSEDRSELRNRRMLGFMDQQSETCCRIINNM
jgi:hypothetical protein